MSQTPRQTHVRSQDHRQHVRLPEFTATVTFSTVVEQRVRPTAQLWAARHPSVFVVPQQYGGRRRGACTDSPPTRICVAASQKCVLMRTPTPTSTQVHHLNLKATYVAADSWAKTVTSDALFIHLSGVNRSVNVHFLPHGGTLTKEGSVSAVADIHKCFLTWVWLQQDFCLFHDPFCPEFGVLRSDQKFLQMGI